ncbi:aminotransferase class I/II-fold pyridoxal phosphate-dependent enzyme [Alteromonas facilis]|uniref:aminotransferase class I/II-fold pyridoxal phosphate-dependent enzyme n=1 Tax=Alteromonas facilis TaxID=2048004 RepID=UPI000C284831|nr:8-amino-7-oxononanoate synthase [Alteromonas facilis]
MAFSFIQSDVAQRQSQALLRKHHVIDQEHEALISVDGKAYINFASNDYLGLRQHPEVLQAWVEGLELYGGGSGASPLVTGYYRAHQQLSETLAEMLGRDEVLLFTSGYAANQAICQALFKHGGVLLADKLSHASLIEAGRNITGEFKRFRHNDMHHLTTLLSGSDAVAADSQNRLIASEGIFSMDGDSADVLALKAMAKENNAWFMIDDAHGFGVIGAKGEGIAASQAEQRECQIVMATLGKACGTGGAFVAGSHDLIAYLTNFARHYIYSTAMSPAQAHATLKALQLVKAGEQRARLHENIGYFRQRMHDADLILSDSVSAIQPVKLGSPERTLAAASRLKELGIWVGAMRYPTVPKGSDRLRITLSSQHHKRDLDVLVDALSIIQESA